MEPQRDLHSFAKTDPEGNSPNLSPKIRDATEDTAPLQGTGDRSDPDSVSDGYEDERARDDAGTDAPPVPGKPDTRRK